jgi:hypothetical protein
MIVNLPYVNCILTLRLQYVKLIHKKCDLKKGENR